MTRTYKDDMGGLLTFPCAQCFGGPTLKHSPLTGWDGRTPLDAHLVDAIVCKLSFDILALILAHKTCSYLMTYPFLMSK